LYIWYAADDASGLNPVRIGGVTDKNYTVSKTYVGKYIGFTVWPIAVYGDSSSLPAASEWIPVELGPVSAAQSDVSALPLSVYADGAEAATVTVTLKDAYGNAISGKTVSLSQGAGSSVITAVNAVTDAKGEAAFTVRSAKIETVTYSAKNETDDISITDTAAVEFRDCTVYAPASGIPSGEVNAGDEIILTSATPGALIYFTADGSVPTAASTPYAGAIRIDRSVTIKAIAVRDGIAVSDVAVYTFTIAPAPNTGLPRVTGYIITAAASLALSAAAFMVYKKEENKK
jgi:hypothetical protein